MQGFRGKKIFLTGHTGFKGSWLALYLNELGATVAGYSLAPEDESHYLAAKPEAQSHIHNINDEQTLTKIMLDFKPDLVFHLAAQPLVLEGYRDPVETYETNVLGSLKVYRASLAAKAKAVVSVTTDKVYENHEFNLPFEEGDRVGGHDPYSSSKACVEIMTDSFRKSFLADHSMLLATARAGNVIGGGDWAKHRLIPDLVRGVRDHEATVIRNPSAVRPWQHVLEPLRGYLMLGARLLEGDQECASSFNFGPDINEAISVGQMCDAAKGLWPEISFEIEADKAKPHEAQALRLGVDKAAKVLGWQHSLDWQESLELTLRWYREWLESKKCMSLDQVRGYFSK